MTRVGSLTVVGIGINFSQHITAEARDALAAAGKVFDLLGDAVSRTWLVSIRPDTESLYKYYGPDEDRTTSYNLMVDRVLSEVRAGSDVVFVSYGHPGVFGFPMHESVRQARADGFPARMLPGISSLDCLFADISVDPGS